MIFDHDPEIGAFLLLNLERSKIEGYLYRVEEVKEGDVTVQRNFYLMDVAGTWRQTIEFKNPFLHHLPEFLSFPNLIGDKAQIDWAIYTDLLQNDEQIPRKNSATPIVPATEISHYDADTGKTKLIPVTYTQAELDAMAAEEANRIKYEVFDKSAHWILEQLAKGNGNNAEAVKALIKSLEMFEYDLGDRK